jgi:hypothetical protein
MHQNGIEIDRELLLLLKCFNEQLLQQVFVCFFFIFQFLFFSGEDIKEYKWKKPSKIVDTHGCGDALAGGNLDLYKELKIFQSLKKKDFLLILLWEKMLINVLMLVYIVPMKFFNDLVVNFLINQIIMENLFINKDFIYQSLFLNISNHFIS